MRRLIEYILRLEDEPVLRSAALDRLFCLRRREWFRWHA